MIKLYNDKNIIVKDLLKFFENIDFDFTKPQLKIIPNLLSSIILSENITTADISKVYIDDSFLTNNDSIQKKIWRFLNNYKFNGFNLEKTKTKNLHAYENLYSLVCLACTWLTIIGADYTKNYKHVKHKLNIRFVKRDKNNKPRRILSLFNLGLTIFR